MTSAISSDLQSLPISDLISVPLIAAVNAQAQMAMTQYQFIKDVGFAHDANGITTSPNMAKFTYDHTDVGGNLVTTMLEVPLLAMVNIPSLTVDDVKVDFTMELSSSVKSNVSTTATAGLSGSAGGWLSPVKVNFSGSVSHSSNTVSTSDRRAVYTVSVKATDHGMPPGLIKVLDILSASVSTVPTPAP